MVKSPDSVRDGSLLSSEDKPFNEALYSLDDDDDDDDCRTDATTLRASNVQQSSPSMDTTGELLASRCAGAARMTELIRRVLGHIQHSDDRNLMVAFLREKFWNIRGDARPEALRSHWGFLTGGQEIDGALLDQLLLVPVNSQRVFIEILDQVNHEIVLAMSTDGSPDHDSDLSDNAGSGSARVQGTVLGQVGPDTADGGATEDAAAVPSGVRNPGRDVVPPGNAQDPDNPTLTRNLHYPDLLAGPPLRPAAAVPLLTQPAAAAVANSSHQECPGCWAPTWLIEGLRRWGPSSNQLLDG